jgi:toxin HigB-1
MEIEFRDERLDRLEVEPGDAGFPPTIVRSYRKRLQFLRQAVSEQDVRGMTSLHFEKLKGDRKHQRSLRLNLQWRLIVELKKKGRSTVVIVVAIENHYR